MNNYSYNELAKFIKSGRSKIEHRVENNTTARFENDNIIVRLHSTDIAIIQPDNTVSLYSGGYKTMTTKDRMNKIIPSPFMLIPEGGIWFISKGWRDDNRYAFADGITIYPNGVITDYNEDWKDTVKLRRDIRKYAKGFINALVNGEVNKPDGGDCWSCLMRTQNNVPLGEETNNTDHLQSHIEEGYYVPSLFYRACEITPMCIVSNGAMYDLWEENKPLNNWQKDLLQRDGYKSLVKYLYMQFGLVY